MSPLKSKLAAVLFVAALIPMIAIVVEAAAPTAQRLNIESATPHQLGTRYGQAAGIALMCYGMKVTPKIEKLKGRFEGKDKEVFDAQAEKILSSWKRALRCEDSQGPNECKLSHTWSCRQGLKELGPKGTVLPGIVEQKVK